MLSYRKIADHEVQRFKIAATLLPSAHRDLLPQLGYCLRNMVRCRHQAICSHVQSLIISQRYGIPNPIPTAPLLGSGSPGPPSPAPPLKPLDRPFPPPIAARRRAIEMNGRILDDIVRSGDEGSGLSDAALAAKAWVDDFGPTLLPSDTDNVHYLLKNMHRDWGTSGAEERRESYGLICDKLCDLFKDRPPVEDPAPRQPRPRVLVPGCGLGALMPLTPPTPPTSRTPFTPRTIPTPFTPRTPRTIPTPPTPLAPLTPFPRVRRSLAV